jgi:hypothetical protein
MVAAESLFNTLNQASRGAGLTISDEVLMLPDVPNCRHLGGCVDVL